ncbi:MAG: ATP-binding protein [Intrasporangium sp.]|uniref:sensor histidine kinase n=1 Tax=Intrasporangium sp. TaxID=1925024 RepID=UPI003F7E9862
MKVEFVLVTQRRRLSLAGQLLVAQFLILFTVLVAVALVSLAQSEATFNRTEGRRVSAVAEQLATLPLVRTEMASGIINATPALVQSVVTQYGVTSITFIGTDGVARVSSDPTLENTRVELGSPTVGQGASWTGVLALDGEQMLVTQTPVLSDAEDRVGDHLGTVMVATRTLSTLDRLRGASSYLITYLGLALGLGGIGSWLLARRLKRQTLGLEPAEITGLAESREAMLYGLAEGVIAIDTNNRITLVNNVAQHLLDLPQHAVGMTLTDLPLGARLRDVLLGVDDPLSRNGPFEGELEGEPSSSPTSDQFSEGEEDSGSDVSGIPAPRVRDQVVLRRGRVLVMNRMEVVKDGRPLGSVTTLRDRTELAELERQLGSFRSATELLRAQAHEFANQLHTISGLIQLGEYDDVVRYVDSVSEHRAALDLSVSRRIEDRAITALVLAKASQATERRVELRVGDHTALGRLSPRDSADLAAVVGNLVDNAIDAAAASEAADKWVELSIRQGGTTVEVVVSDSGPGVAPELVTEVFTHGFTTKAAAAGERGIGLGLIRLICRRRGGEVNVENTPEGAVFTASMTVEPVPEVVR